MARPVKLPQKDVWELYRRHVLRISDADRRGYLLQLKLRTAKERRSGN